MTSHVRTLQDPNVTLSQLIPTLVTLTLATEQNTNKTTNLSPKNPLLVDFQKLLPRDLTACERILLLSVSASLTNPPASSSIDIQG